MKHTVGSEGGNIAPIDFGISLSVPRGAVPLEDIQEISIQPCLSGPFEYPEGYEPLSAVYLITTTVAFQKAVELRLNHYARLETEEQASQMTFLSASTRDIVSGKKFEFKPIGGKFRVNERHGTLQLKHFCVITAGSKKSAGTGKDWLSYGCFG